MTPTEAYKQAIRERHNHPPANPPPLRDAIIETLWRALEIACGTKPDGPREWTI